MALVCGHRKIDSKGERLTDSQAVALIDREICPACLFIMEEQAWGKRYCLCCKTTWVARDGKPKVWIEG